jgi:hypothetical protein
MPADRKGLLRQGDVLLVPVEAVPFVGRGAVEEGPRLVLARGEATGHAHVVLGRAKLLRPRRPRATRARTFLLVEEPATLVHEEHDPVPVAPGAYEVRRQREYAPARREDRSARWVAD